MSTLLFLNEKTKIIFPTKTRILSNTVGDLIIEILTNVVDIDLEMSSPVLPLINTVIANISSTTVNISKFSAVRLYDFLRFYFSSKISERTEFNSSIEKLLISIFNLTRIQTFSNHNLLLKGFEELILLEEISNSNVETWREIVKKLLKIINAAEMPLTQTTEAKEKSLEVHNAISPILAEYSQIPFLKQVEITTIKRNPTIIYDWFRVMFWELIPDDTVKYNLRFSSFSLYEQNYLSDSDSDVKENVNNEKDDEDINDVDDADVVDDDETSEIGNEINEVIQKENINNNYFDDENNDDKKEKKDLNQPTEDPFGKYDDFLNFINST
ncbi:hypothetical protein GPJ56_000462 [Histomonas meleagridis]|uniref:uncharacterized protein n=1 Tax=Histomonas meleagridis TaxID=135588 RepID=UPI0035595411|nr:hypothetical protein GPJ56_000462 [Histomonas meleagridis]KAH0796499.1 hypothetical protein GO595_010392 [Histomonas meleagridis]